MLVAIIAIGAAATLWWLDRRPMEVDGRSPLRSSAETAAGTGSPVAPVSGSRPTASSGVLPPDAMAKVDALIRERGSAIQRSRDANQKVRDEFASRFGRERVDARWAGDKQDALDRVAAQVEAAAGEPPSSFESECRRTMCRTVATFGDRGAAEQWVSFFMASMGNTTRRSAVNFSDQGGGVRVEIFSLAM